MKTLLTKVPDGLAVETQKAGNEYISDVCFYDEAVGEQSYGAWELMSYNTEEEAKEGHEKIVDYFNTNGVADAWEDIDWKNVLGLTMWAGSSNA